MTAVRSDYICHRCMHLLKRTRSNRRPFSSSAKASWETFLRRQVPPEGATRRERAVRRGSYRHTPSGAQWTKGALYSTAALQSAQSAPILAHQLDQSSKYLATSPASNAHQDTDASTTRTTKAKGSSNRDYLNISDNDLALRWDTVAPTAAQLEAADSFFTRRPPKFIWSAAKLRDIKLPPLPRNDISSRTRRDDSASEFTAKDNDIEEEVDTEPRPSSMALPEASEVAFLGRSNVGKSTLLNAILGSNSLCHTSSKPGRTRTMNAISVHDGRLIVLDMPGYGRASREEWGKEIMKYLENRKAYSLRRTFILIDALHGIKVTDHALLSHLRESGIPHQIILSKVDRIIFPKPTAGGRLPSESSVRTNLTHLQETMHDLKNYITAQPTGRYKEQLPQALGEILGVSAEKVSPRVVVEATKGIRGAKAALERLLSVNPDPADEEGIAAAAAAAQKAVIRKDRLGINALRWAILCATGLEGVASNLAVKARRRK